MIHQCKQYSDKKYFYGAFVNYDDSPRRGSKGRCIKGQNVDVFEKYMQKLLDISKKDNKEFIFFTAWNEWGEGAYLEPDIIDKYKYLEAIKRLNK